MSIVETIDSVYDGDTFRATIADWPPIIGHRMGIRVNGVDTPEIRGKCRKEKELAKAARQYTATVLQEAEFVELRNIRRGKYFRIVADVYVDGENLSEKLIRDGHAVEYDGGKKTKNWCKQGLYTKLQSLRRRKTSGRYRSILPGNTPGKSSPTTFRE
uniref:Nuclease homologue n=1 Tax=Candidatus Kentrum sp. TUN TaxID=2126343 RepID=A0A451AN71_9GAMM|nr:MAG: nuclease homologue [Candidatus Kentron sp. TUN]VFK67459.1 MAG: nuclease homologue [Candidatus Kentron sp. TUN]